jgi:hypothetical protein
MRRFLAANPFLSVGLLGTFIFGTWLALGLQPHDGGVGQAGFYLWRVLAAPVHVAANVLGRVTNDWPDVLDAGAAVVVGLLPYLAADALWRRWRRRRGHRPALAP